MVMHPTIAGKASVEACTAAPLCGRLPRRSCGCRRFALTIRVRCIYIDN